MIAMNRSGYHMQEYFRNENTAQINITHKSYCVLNSEDNAISDRVIIFVRQLSVYKYDCMWKEVFPMSGGFGTHSSEAPAGEKEFKYVVSSVQGVRDDLFIFFLLV